MEEYDTSASKPAGAPVLAAIGRIVKKVTEIPDSGRKRHTVETIPDSAMSSIVVQSAELTVSFSEAYNAAPPLPRPLVSRFDLKFITSAGMLDEATSIAPLDAEEEATNDPSEKAHLETYGTLARRIKIQTLMLNRSNEFALVHQDLKNWSKYARVGEAFVEQYFRKGKLDPAFRFFRFTDNFVGEV